MKLFESVGPQGKLWTIPTFLNPITSTISREDAISQYRELEAKAEKFLGRKPTPDEMRAGVSKPPLSKEQITESRRQKVRDERAARLEAEAAYDPTQDRLRTAQERAEQERRAGLSAAARELEDASEAARLAQERQADKARKARLRESGAYQQLRSAINDLLLVSKLSVDVSQEQVNLIEAQSRDLERHMDLAATRQNLAQLQQVVSGQLAVQDAELQQAIDRSEMRKKLLASGSTFDSVDVELVGDLAFVCLSVNGVTKKVSQSAYDSRTSDEALKTQLFGGSEVANV